MILSCHNISKSFGENIIVENGSFHIENHEKAALVGINGAGKSTILKMIIGELDADDGVITVSSGKTLGYLAQHQDLESGRTVYEEVRSALQDVFELEQRIRELELSMRHLSGSQLQEQLEQYHRLTTEFERRDGYAAESEIIGVLKGLGFTEEDFTKKVDTLSGGEKTRVSLGKLLLTTPDILLLDEPINHLDLHSIAWLEGYLLNYKGAILLVAHDRYFMNRVVTKIIELERGKIRMYQGNYNQYAEKKALIREAQMKEYLKQEQQIRHQEAVIQKLRSFNREKSIKRAESREKMLERLTPLEKPADDTSRLHIELVPSVLSGNDVLSVEGLSKAFTDTPLFTDISFDIKRGEHVAIIGDNGTGKTTLLKILNGLIPADAGSFRLGSNVEIGYYDQEQELLDPDSTVFEEISSAYPTLTNTQIRNTLAAFLFTDDDVFKRIRDLSGGEKGRISLARLMLSGSNFIILDEPTNHLDIVSKEILEHALNQYQGTVLYVSHDRYFINQTATRILELKGQTFISYPGNYDYYLEKREELSEVCIRSAPEQRKENTDNSARLDWAAQKEQQARERKRKNELARTENRITEIEQRQEAIDTLMTREEVYTNSVRCQELSKEKTALEEELEELLIRWEELS